MADTKSQNPHMRIHVLASGSKGNASIIEDVSTGQWLLVDCGICKRDFFERSAEVGVDPQKIEGILITHEHTDHTKGLGVVLRGLAKVGVSPTLYTSVAVRRSCSEIINNQDSREIKYFKAGDAISAANITTHVFATSHDAAESFGFRFEQENEAIGYITDSGVVTAQAFEALRNCRVLALESNHDKRMLETGPYPYVLKQRVASDVGHLSNEQAAGALEQLLSTKLEHVIAMHISENNNTYRLPCETLGAVVANHNHNAQVHSAYQYRILSI